MSVLPFYLLLILLILRLTVGERWQIVALVNDNLHLLLLPSLILLPLCLLTQRWRISLLLSPAVFTWASASSAYWAC